MPICEAYGCNTRTSGKGKTPWISFFAFPKKDQGRCKEWVHRLGRANFQLKPHSCLCEIHFEESMFLPDLQKAITGIPYRVKKKLNPDAVPTKLKQGLDGKWYVGAPASSSTTFVTPGKRRLLSEERLRKRDHKELIEKLLGNHDDSIQEVDPMNAETCPTLHEPQSSLCVMEKKPPKRIRSAEEKRRQAEAARDHRRRKSADPTWRAAEARRVMARYVPAQEKTAEERALYNAQQAIKMRSRRAIMARGPQKEPAGNIKVPRTRPRIPVTHKHSNHPPVDVAALQALLQEKNEIIVSMAHRIHHLEGHISELNKKLSVYEDCDNANASPLISATKVVENVNAPLHCLEDGGNTRALLAPEGQEDTTSHNTLSETECPGHISAYETGLDGNIIANSALTGAENHVDVKSELSENESHPHLMEDDILREIATMTADGVVTEPIQGDRPIAMSADDQPVCTNPGEEQPMIKHEDDVDPTSTAVDGPPSVQITLGKHSSDETADIRTTALRPSTSSGTLFASECTLMEIGEDDVDSAHELSTTISTSASNDDQRHLHKHINPQFKPESESEGKHVIGT